SQDPEPIAATEWQVKSKKKCFKSNKTRILMKIKASHILSMVVLTITLLVVLAPTTTLAQKVLPVQGPEVVVQPDQPPASRSPGCCVCPSGSYYNAQRASCIK